MKKVNIILLGVVGVLIIGFLVVNDIDDSNDDEDELENMVITIEQDEDLNTIVETKTIESILINHTEIEEDVSSNTNESNLLNSDINDIVNLITKDNEKTKLIANNSNSNKDIEEFILTKDIPEKDKIQLINYGITITNHLDKIPKHLVNEILNAAKEQPKNARDTAQIVMISKYPRFFDYIDKPSDKVLEVISY